MVHLPHQAVANRRLPSTRCGAVMHMGHRLLPPRSEWQWTARDLSVTTAACARAQLWVHPPWMRAGTRRLASGSRRLICGVSAARTGGVEGVALRAGVEPPEAATASTAPATAPPSPYEQHRNAKAVQQAPRIAVAMQDDGTAVNTTCLRVGLVPMRLNWHASWHGYAGG